MFISATSMFSQSYKPENRAKAQAFNEFFVFGCVAITAMLSGWLEATIGWQNLNLYTAPFVVIVMLMFVLNARKSRKVQAREIE